MSPRSLSIVLILPSCCEKPYRTVRLSQSVARCFKSTSPSAKFSNSYAEPFDLSLLYRPRRLPRLRNGMHTIWSLNKHPTCPSHGSRRPGTPDHCLM